MHTTVSVANIDQVSESCQRIRVQQRCRHFTQRHLEMEMIHEDFFGQLVFGCTRAPKKSMELEHNFAWDAQSEGGPVPLRPRAHHPTRPPPLPGSGAISLARGWRGAAVAGPLQDRPPPRRGGCCARPPRRAQRRRASPNPSRPTAPPTHLPALPTRPPVFPLLSTAAVVAIWLGGVAASGSSPSHSAGPLLSCSF